MSARAGNEPAPAYFGDSFFFVQAIYYGYLESSPDPGCQFPASTSPKNMGEMFKIILFNEYDESEWSSLMTKRDNLLLNKNNNFLYSSSFDPMSSPSNHLLKNIF